MSDVIDMTGNADHAHRRYRCGSREQQQRRRVATFPALIQNVHGALIQLGQAAPEPEVEAGAGGFGPLFGQARLHRLPRRRQEAEDAQAPPDDALSDDPRAVSRQVEPAGRLSDGRAQLCRAAPHAGQEDRPRHQAPQDSNVFALSPKLRGEASAMPAAIHPSLSQRREAPTSPPWRARSISRRCAPKRASASPSSGASSRACCRKPKTIPTSRRCYERASAIDPGISIATVYRTVRLFEEAGILDRHDFGDGRSRYEPAPEAHHDHLIDVETGKVIEFVDPELETAAEARSPRSSASASSITAWSSTASPRPQGLSPPTRRVRAARCPRGCAWRRRAAWILALLLISCPAARSVAAGPPPLALATPLPARCRAGRPARDVRIVGVPLTRDVFYVANHLSWIDILAIAGPQRHRLRRQGRRFAARRWSAGSPTLNRTVFVARENAAACRTDQRAARCAGRGLVGHAVSRRHAPTDGHSLLPFKTPRCSRVLEPPPPGVLVQPVRSIMARRPRRSPGSASSSTGTDDASASSPARPAAVDRSMRCLEPIDPAGLPDRKAIAAEAGCDRDAADARCLASNAAPSSLYRRRAMSTPQTPTPRPLPQTYSRQILRLPDERL